MVNLLENGTFEANWSDHRCLIATLDGEAPYWRDVGNVFNPAGWNCWFTHVPDVWDQPEVRDLHKSQTPERVRGGDKAILLFTFHRCHEAGFLQQVQVEPGTRLRLSAYAHAWSNHKDKAFPDEYPHPDDGLWSEGAGYAPRKPQEGEQCVWLEGDTQDDRLRNFTFYVAIDPTGGLDPASPDIIRGQGAHIYNAYAEVPPVEAVAQGDTVTVWLVSKTLWAYKHNDAHWDDASLVVVDEPPEPCRGTPRIQYARTYVLVPPGENISGVVGAGSDTIDREEWTVGKSADDAGIGDLDERNVIGLNPAKWPGNLRDFFKEHIPA